MVIQVKAKDTVKVSRKRATTVLTRQYMTAVGVEMTKDKLLTKKYWLCCTLAAMVMNKVYGYQKFHHQLLGVVICACN